jgi:hypothetical protein
MEPGEQEGLKPLVYANRLQGLLLSDLTSAGSDGPLVDELRSLSDDRVTAHVGVLADLQRIVTTLESTGIAVVAFKGPVLAELAYRDPSLRPYGDIDVLVDATKFDSAVTALERTGYELIDANWGLIVGEGRSQLHLRTPFGNTVDLHWHVFNRRGVRRAFGAGMTPVFGRSVRASVGGVDVNVMDPADTIIHLAANYTLGGGRRLLRSVDVRYQIERYEPPWDLVVARTREWRIEVLVWLTLLRARQLAGARVPIEVTRALQPGKTFMEVTRYVERRWPYARPAPESDFGELWANSLRPSALGTGRALGERSLRWTRNRVRDSTDAFEARRGTKVTRADYFAAVGRNR